MPINKKIFFEYVSNINDINKFVSYSQELNKNNYTTLVKHLVNSSTGFIYLNNPSQKFSFIAIGEILSIGNKNKTDQQDVRELLFKVKKNYYHNLNKTNFKRIPLFVGAHKFPLIEKSELWKDFDYEKWFIPKYIMLQNNDCFSFIINYLGNEIEPENYLEDLDMFLTTPGKNEHKNFSQTKAIRLNENDAIDWNKIVTASLDKISKKELEKVVTARKIELEIESGLCLSDIITTLEETYPRCYSFIYRRKESTFFGATPEKLFGVENGVIETDALAGSIQRGDSEISDKELGLQLLESEKDIIEHNSVRNFLLEKLYHVTENIFYDSTPMLRKLSNIQHLWTPITAKLKNDIDVLSLIKDIYPTPAICGYPTDTALKLIGNLENFDRGLYAGIIGWFNLQNEGEFAVALRSALIKDNMLHAFAGCGIVEGSNPISEYYETELKLKPILSLFVDETINQP